MEMKEELDDTLSHHEDSSDNESDNEVLAKQIPVKVPKKRGRKPKAQKVTPPPKAAKKKKEKDANEPKKPLSAYAMFFRDTQAAIKGQNSTATFGEISKIVASMWEALDPEHKNVYKKKNESARKDYLKAMEDYKAGKISEPEQNAENENHAEENDESENMDTSNVSDEPEPVSTVSFVPLQLSPSQLSSPTMDYNNTTSPPPPIPQERSTVITRVPEPKQPDLTPPVDTIDPLPGTKCIRDGCSNLGIQNSEWEDEYCSSDCVMLHCKDVFNSWVTSNKSGLRGMT